MVRVFVSYAHDSMAHCAAVRSLADRMRDDGIDVHLDAYDPFPRAGMAAVVPPRDRGRGPRPGSL
ncbi:MAG: hypothetical protein K0V04_39915 [Deltaproteobacteria bacterium]|nr:hypothetical protein [Deltaproteobacteria bacterium]